MRSSRGDCAAVTATRFLPEGHADFLPLCEKLVHERAAAILDAFYAVLATIEQASDEERSLLDPGERLAIETMMGP
jgi:hypothetical protein